jgi:hypothetical protein
MTKINRRKVIKSRLSPDERQRLSNLKILAEIMEKYDPGGKRAYALVKKQIKKKEGKR